MPAYKKYLVAVLVGTLVVQPMAALAQLGGIVGGVPVTNPGELSGIAGSAAQIAAKAAYATAFSINEGCARTEEAFFVANKALDIAYGGLSLIGGSAAETADLEILKQEIDGFIICRNRARDALLAMVVTNIYDGQTKQRLADEINLAINTLKRRKEDIANQSKIAKRGLWKGIMASLLIKTTKIVAQRLVNSLTSTYKINEIMQYADSVASNVYTAQLIYDRAADNEEQLILRSIISNPLLRTKIDNVIYQRAADALQLNGDVFSARGMSADDPDFYLKLAKFGDPQTHVPYLKTAYENRAAEIQSAGLISAQNEILVGSGLKAPRSCAGNVNEQKSIELRWEQANDKLANRQELYNDLYEAYNTKYYQLTPQEQKRLTQDLNKAENDYIKASQELKALPTTFKSVDNKETGQKKSNIYKICETIASPATAVNMGIDEAFKAFGKGMSDYNDNNLPFFMDWISDIGANIASGLIFGQDPKAVLLGESGNIAQAINLGISFADSKVDPKNLENGIYFTSAKGNSATEYILSWEILDVKNAAFVTIKGDGISDIKTDPKTGQVIADPITKQPVLNTLPLSGSVAVKTSKGGNYILRVYDSSGKLLTNQGSLAVTVSNGAAPAGNAGQNSACGGNYTSYQACVDQVGDAAYCGSLCGVESVRGAFVSKPLESLRGEKKESLR